MTDIRTRESVSASAVANHLLNHNVLSGKITNIQLNKMIYIIHGFCLAVKDISILDVDNHEYVEVSKHGVRIPSIYHEFKTYFHNPIPKGKQSIAIMHQTSTQNEYYIPILSDIRIINISNWAIDTLFIKNNQIVSENKLLHFTHSENTPSYELYKEAYFYKRYFLTSKLNNKKIKHWFLKLVDIYLLTM